MLATKLQSVRDKFMVECKRKRRKRETLPWLNDNIWQMMKQRDLALKKATKTKLDTDILIYKGLRNKVVNELRSAKSSFYIHALNEAKGNGKNIWKHIKNLIGREGHHTENIKLKSQGKLIRQPLHCKYF